MNSRNQIVLAQLNFRVGEIEGNVQRILDTAAEVHSQRGGVLLAFSELCLTGYPPEDLLLRPEFIEAAGAALERLIKELPPELAVVVGHPGKLDGALSNAASVIHGRGLQCTYHKACLPNYGVFDEKRYFSPGGVPCLFDWMGLKFGLTICEDVWWSGPVEASAEAGADCVININGSPFHNGQVRERERVVGERARHAGVPIVYVNQVGGQDELVFDGGSFVVDSSGQTVMRCPQFEEAVDMIVLRDGVPLSGTMWPGESVEADVYRALTLGVQDYVNNNGFKSAVLGLSGGVDSALTLTVAVDALGADRVQAVMMPSRYTSTMSLEDAAQQCEALGVEHHVVSIEPMFEAFLSQLQPVFKDLPRDATEENVQARCRGTLLMAISNKIGAIVLTTGNKSELAVGYATLYGDMAGGFAVIKDVPKTLVYRLVDYRNGLSPVIPRRVIERAPSAELAEDQVDQDSLPPYEILDPIIEYYVERDLSPGQIVAQGYDRDTVLKVVGMIDRNEYKRRQSPPGVRITPRAFGRDRRYPITSGYRSGRS